MIERLRMRFFALALLLRLLSDSSAIERLENKYASQSDGQNRVGVLLGYKLIVETALYKQTDLIATCPEILLLEVDHDLARWWSNTERKSTATFSVGMRGEVPKSAYVANYINDLMLRVVRCGNRWESFAEVSEFVHSFARAIELIRGGCSLSVSRFADSEPNVEIDHALRLCAAELLHDFLYDQHDFSLDDAYAYTYPNRLVWEEGSVIADLGFSELATSRDVVGTKPPEVRSPQKQAYLGINAALEVAIPRLGSVPQLTASTEGVLLAPRQIFGSMLAELQPGRWPCTRYALTMEAQPCDGELRAIMLNEAPALNPRQYLTDLFRDRAFLVSGISSNADLHFQVLIGGLLMVTSEDDLVEVLHIEHQAPPDEFHPPVSVAIRVRMDWHVFYKIDAVGRMKSPIWQLLDDFSDRIEVTRLKGIQSEHLLALCDRGFQYVSRQWKAQKDLNSDLRGAIPELLAAALLTRSGYFPVQPSLKVIKGIGQIDAIGFKESVDGGECKLVEVKKRSTNQNQLQTEINDFNDKLEKARKRICELERVMGFTGQTKQVSGLFISMAEVGDLSVVIPERPERFPGFFETPDVRSEFKRFLDSLPDVEFWDYTRFRRELEAAGLPDIPISLLEEARLTWVLPDVDIADQEELWGLLDEAVQGNQWQSPADESAVKDRVEEILRDL